MPASLPTLEAIDALARALASPRRHACVGRLSSP
jgi:hypothetical protein